MQKNRKIDTLTTDHQNCSRSLLGTSLVHSQTAIRDQAIIINCIRGPPYWEIYSSKLQNVFVQILKIICIRDQAIIINCIRGPYWKIYSSKLQNVFVQILKTICLYCIGYLSKFQIVFVKISKSMCPNCKKIIVKFQKDFHKVSKKIISTKIKLLSKFQNIFVQSVKIICKIFGLAWYTLKCPLSLTALGTSASILLYFVFNSSLFMSSVFV